MRRQPPALGSPRASYKLFKPNTRRPAPRRRPTRSPNPRHTPNTCRVEKPPLKPRLHGASTKYELLF